MLNKMRSYKALAVTCSFTLLLATLLAPISVAQQFDSAGANQLVELINQERAREGLPPLAVDERLTLAARKHTELLVKHHALSHQFAEEQPLQVRLADENLRSDRQAENCALEVDVAGAHDVLMNSPHHRANILNPRYNAVGVALMQSGEQLYVTEDFAHRLPDYSEPEADAVLQKAVTDYARKHGSPAPVRKPQPALHDMACHMAVIDALDTGTPRNNIVGVRRVLAWTATDLEQLPGGIKALLSEPLSNGYSLGVCFAGSASHPGGIYWISMVTY